MAQKTDLNVSPYYDDFDADDNFNRVLFRPGFAVQARELTTLQSILQNQIERHGNHMFKEGAMVIPGQISYSDNYHSIQLASTFGGEDVIPAQYYNTTTPVIITGATSGVQAKVIGYKAATSTTQPLLYVQYIKTGSDYKTEIFSDSENISADATITHTTSYSANTASSTTYSSSAAQTGSAVTVEAGVYFVRGQFVRVTAETLVLSDTSKTPSKRVGFIITETLITPESDSTLTDNATGSANYAAKGAHRLKVNVSLGSLDSDSTADSSFIELMNVTNGRVQNIARNTQYSVLGDTLARRTYDESGDYTVRPFQFDMRESLDSTVQNVDFDGVYSSGATTDDANTASSSLLSLAITPGKAYIRGYEIEKIAATYKDINKARDVDTVNAGISIFEVGNYAKITNLFQIPDISSVSGETTPYKVIGLYDNVTQTRGSAAGNQIGVARARTIQYESGTAGNTDAIYRLYFFDVRPFTKLTLSDTPSPTLIASHANGGVQLKGNTSGATGYVWGPLTSVGDVYLTGVSGEFSSGEKLIASDSEETSEIIENSSNTDLTVSTITAYQFNQVRQVFMDDDDSGQDFTADLVLDTSGEEGEIVLNGTDSNSTNANDNLILDGTGSGSEDEGSNVLRENIKEAKLKSPEKNVSIFKLPKRVIKTLLTDDNNNASDSQITVRRQFVGTTNASGVVSFTAGNNETFISHAEKDYTMSVLTAGSGGASSQGDILSISSTMAGAGTATLTITDNTNLANGAKVKLTATLLRTSVASKAKTTQLSKQVKVATGATDAYGTRPTDRTISLGRADVFKLVGVFDSEDTSSDASAPTLTCSITGTFSRGEKITGSSSGATARIITTTSPISYVLDKGFGATDFTTSDTITGASSGATATISTVTAGSKVITSSFTLDTGQRDNFYDVARLERKQTSDSPRGRLLIVYDYFTHAAGDYFSVDSYTDVGGRMEYDDIPTYSATRIDPDDPEPSGQFPLADCYDLRPTCEDVAGTSTTLASVDEITGNSFDFFSRQFDGTNATTVDSPQPDSNLQADFEYYLPKMANLFLTHNGDFKLIEGISSENPQLPKDIDHAMKLATMFIPAYTFRPDDVIIQRHKTQRFTMKDIGKLQDRINNVEYYTALSLLERDAESFEVQDVNGLSRFKSGFVVDNFAGHRIGDVQNKDYQCSIDMSEHELRPKAVMRGATLTEEATSDTARTTAGYQKTGDLITLPYSHTEMTKQPYATTIENVQPFMKASWVGLITLSPASDEWFETEVAPALIINVDGNFNAVLAANQNTIGTVWNAWETQWSGVVSQNQISTTTDGRGWIWERVAQTTRTDLARTGLRSRIVEQIDEESQGSRIISRALIPFVRARNITITGYGFKGNTRVYGFFDKKDVSSYITPASTTYTTDTTAVAGSPFISTASGKLEGTFGIPEHRFAGQENVPKFQTGELEFRLTSSSTDDRTTSPVTAGQTIYQAKGILETEEETIIATRNGIFVQDEVNETTSTTSTLILDQNTGSRARRATVNGVCFVEGTKILMQDPSHSEKNIEDVVVGDEVHRHDGGSNKVLKLQNTGTTGGRKLGSINGGDYFFTEDHPLKTPEGWKAINAKMASQKYHIGAIGELQVGDTIIGHNGDDTVIESIDTKEVPHDTRIYNFELDGDHEYFANGFLVHNKDPLAQTFVCDQQGGAFITKVDLYFATKDDNLPVWVEIRNVVNGYPGKKILPFGRKVLEPADVNLSDTAATATTFTFDSPIYLKEGLEYCIVAMTQSLHYKLWISQMGETDVGGSRLVSDQPHMGVLFKSQNNSTWNAVQTQDMKFTLYRAEFTTTDGTLTFTNDNIGDSVTAEDGSTTVYGRRLLPNPLILENGSTVMKVRHTDHGHYSTSNNVRITGASSGISTTLDGAITASATSLTLTSATNFEASSLSSRCYVKIDNEILYGTLSSTTISSLTRAADNTTAAAHSDDATVELYQILKTPLTEINTSFTAVANVSMDYYTLTLTTAPTVSGASSTAEVGQTEVTVSENYRYETTKTMLGVFEPPNTTLAAKIRATTATSPAGSETSFTTATAAKAVSIPINQNYEFDAPQMVCSPINETNELGGAKSLFMPITLSTEVSNLSPVIDLDRKSLICVGNRINNVDSSSDVYPTTDYRASTEPEGDQNAFIYITKRVALENPATALKIFFAANRHSTAELKVLFKILRSDSAEDFDELSYQFFNTTGTTDNTTASSLDRDDLQQYVYTAGVTDDGIGDPLPEFIQFAIKVVGQGTNAAQPIRIRDLRAIALAT